MQALLINSVEGRVEPVVLPMDLASYNKEVNRLLKCSSHIYTISTDKTTQLIADENCLINESNIAFHSSFFKRPLFGNVLIIGRDPATGDKTNLPAAINALTIQVEFCSEQDTARFRLEAMEYAESIQNKRQ
ncbi:hypothetical protein A3860_17300 [Niastella vici]|uniref:Uncharacterized protein n=1 Tax=Niastella vici TaxID=1703345 RepID=A0A1V9G4D1_9BACT|nr:hypothetical protein [Niastella vici]OQP65420.1 hypothetical protein A3860_17300 [Niastella vici]